MITTHTSFTALTRLVIVVLWGMVSAKAAPTHELVASFHLPPTYPNAGALALGQDGYFWGTTSSGGTFSLGTIYKVKADGSDWVTVLSFTGNDGTNKGYSPSAGLVSDGSGFFWGTTSGGGANGSGTIFKVNASTGALTTIVEFTGNGLTNRGANPSGGLVSDGAGYFWGTTSGGGANGFGTVFKVNAVTGVLTTLVHFTSNGPANKGQNPSGDLVSDGAGFFWGTTSAGGSSNLGTVFKVDASTGTLATLIQFTGNGATNKGANPLAGLVGDGAGYFWGTTSAGAANNFGTVFKINANTGALSTLVEFTGNGTTNKGAKPRASLVNDGAGYFWGTTERGGPDNRGTVFKINTSTGALTTLVEFTHNGAINKGSLPYAGLVSDGAGYFWGTTNLGGANETGTVFRINVSTGALTTLVEFTNQGATNKGIYPYAGLVSDGAGYLWGTTQSGGATGNGTIFKINPSTGTLTTLVEFTFNGSANRGSAPTASLVSDGAGNFWGTTVGGDNKGYGTAFKINASTGVLTTLVEFTLNGATNKGAYPMGGLVSDGAGYFWGATGTGGSTGLGTIFKINASTGALTTIIEFTFNGPTNKGRNPSAGLVSDGAGYLWGTTALGGAIDFGTLFKINASTGALTTLVEFTGNGAINKGAHPCAALVSDGAGYLWGTTSDTAPELYDGPGTVFKVNASTGALTTLLEFTGNGATNKGLHPRTSLVSDGAGSFWGTTETGGVSDEGTVFKVNASTGALATLIEFTGIGLQPNNGSNPSSLLRAADGNFYGTTVSGGPGGGGTIYRIRLGPTPLTQSANGVATTSATLHGTLNPNGTTSTASFEWGTSSNLTTNSLASAGTTSAGTAPEAVSANLTGLIPNTTYYFRVRGENSENAVPQLGHILSFTTLPANAPTFAGPVNGGGTVAGQGYTGSVAGSASDVDAGDLLTYSKAAGPAWLTIAADGTLSGTPASGDIGTNSFTLRATDTAGLYAETTLTITVYASPWQSWQASKFGANAGNPPIAGDMADPDGDGLCNLLEYAVGTNPNTGNAVTIVLDMETVAGAKYLRLTITKNPAATDVQFTVQVNGDVSNAAGWNGAETVIEQNTASTLVVRDAVPAGPRFIRLKVARP
jgi:uncharacterized repeat protein (TIGR03803 family)